MEEELLEIKRLAKFAEDACVRRIKHAEVNGKCNTIGKIVQNLEAFKEIQRIITQKEILFPLNK